MKNRDGLINNNDWKTGKEFYNLLDKEFGFTFDPCPFKHDLKKWNGLEVDWGAVNFVNPPYDAINKPKFIEKAIVEWKKGKTVVLLLPVSTSTKQFHKYFWDNEKHKPKKGVQIRFPIGRIRHEGINTFNKKSTKAKGKHDSMLIILK